MNVPQNIIVHHSAVSRTKNNEQFDAIDRYHKGKGWGSIGYHYLIEPSGEVKRGREEKVTGAHCKESLMNYRSIGICLTGNFDIEEPTVEQKIALKKLIEDIQSRHNIPVKNIVPHRHYATYKSCWGKLLPDDIMGYLDLDETPSGWAAESWKKAKKKGVLTKGPKDLLDKQTLAVVLDRLHLLD